MKLEKQRSRHNIISNDSSSDYEDNSDQRIDDEHNLHQQQSQDHQKKIEFNFLSTTTNGDSLN
jgi:hypothetical protein